MTTLQDLIAQKDALERQIAEIQKTARADAISKVKALMAEYGLTAADLAHRTGDSAKKAPGAKVAAKYRDPASGQTWSGRGLKPKWLQTQLAAGRALSDFAI